MDQARTQYLAGTVFSSIAISNTVTGSTVLVKVVPGVVQWLHWLVDAVDEHIPAIVSWKDVAKSSADDLNQRHCGVCSITFTARHKDKARRLRSKPVIVEDPNEVHI